LTLITILSIIHTLLVQRVHGHVLGGTSYPLSTAATKIIISSW